VLIPAGDLVARIGIEHHAGRIAEQGYRI